MDHSFSSNYYAYSAWQGSSGGGGVGNYSGPSSKFHAISEDISLISTGLMLAAPIVGAIVGGISQIIDGPLSSAVIFSIQLNPDITSKVGVGAFMGLCASGGIGAVTLGGLIATGVSLSLYKKSKELFNNFVHNDNEVAKTPKDELIERIKNSKASSNNVNNLDILKDNDSLNNKPQHKFK